MKRSILVLFILVGFWSLGHSNNVSIDSLKIINDSTIRFTISWENSWKVITPPANHDAVWLFVKKEECTIPNYWYHQDVSTTASDHSAGDPLEVYCDGYNNAGIFVRRSAAGYGDIENVEVTMKILNVQAASFNFEVFAVEMVYVNEESFYLGDEFSDYRFIQSGGGLAYHVTSDAAIPVGATAGYLAKTGINSYNPALTPPSVPDSFPKGYNAFYCMKYEVSQSQIADFFNHISQAAYVRWAAWIKDEPASGQDITNSTWPNFSTAQPFRSVYARGTYITAGELELYKFQQAFLDFSGLRPMTEMEYEKVCRGSAYPMVGEHAWGTASHTPFRPDTTNPDTLYFGTPSETHSISLAAGFGIAVAPKSGIASGMVYRSGFASKPGNNRTQSGASYYGVMDMSGNVEELVVICRGENYTFSKTNVGDGHLVIGGGDDAQANQGWPVLAEYFGMKGGGIRYSQAYYTDGINQHADYGTVSSRGGFSNQVWRTFIFMRGVR